MPICFCSIGIATILKVWHEPPPATAAFARSRLPRSLLNAHSAAPGVGLKLFIHSGDCADKTSNSSLLFGLALPDEGSSHITKILCYTIDLKNFSVKQKSRCDPVLHS
jgi:hypothetical protein